MRTNNNSKIIIFVLAVLLAVSVIWNIKLSTNVSDADITIAKTISEKEKLIKDLEKLQTTYEGAIKDSTSLSEELKLEKNKVVKLLALLKNSSGDVAKYKNEIEVLKNKMLDLIEANEQLKAENTILTLQRDSTVVVLSAARKENETLNQKIEKASKLSILNLQAAAFKLKKSGKAISTDKASRANTLRISFLIAENAIAKSEDKDYYVQVIDGKKNVLGESKTVYFGQKELLYSFITTVQYENKTVQVSEDLPGKDFAKGIYTVNIFDKDRLVSSSSFSLR